MSEAGQAAVSSDGEIAAMKVGGLRQRGLWGRGAKTRSLRGTAPQTLLWAQELIQSQHEEI